MKSWKGHFDGLTTKCKLYIAYGTAMRVILHSKVVYTQGKLAEMRELTEEFERVYNEVVVNKKK